METMETTISCSKAYQLDCTHILYIKIFCLIYYYSADNRNYYSLLQYFPFQIVNRIEFLVESQPKTNHRKIQITPTEPRTTFNPKSSKILDNLTEM